MHRRNWWFRTNGDNTYKIVVKIEWNMQQIAWCVCVIYIASYANLCSNFKIGL